MMVFDLDPGAPADIVQCCQVGLWLRDLLGKMKLKSFAKTSGSKGLQVYVPLNTAVTYDQNQGFVARTRPISGARTCRSGHFEHVQGSAQRQSVRRLEPERRTQNHHLRLFTPRQGRADRFNSGHLERSRKLPQKEKSRSFEIPFATKSLPAWKNSATSSSRSKNLNKSCRRNGNI